MLCCLELSRQLKYGNDVLNVPRAVLEVMLKWRGLQTQEVREGPRDIALIQSLISCQGHIVMDAGLLTLRTLTVLLDGSS
jgi:hypothetical protein